MTDDSRPTAEYAFPMEEVSEIDAANIARIREALADPTRRSYRINVQTNEIEFPRVPLSPIEMLEKLIQLRRENPDIQIIPLIYYNSNMPNSSFREIFPGIQEDILRNKPIHIKASAQLIERVDYIISTVPRLICSFCQQLMARYPEYCRPSVVML